MSAYDLYSDEEDLTKDLNDDPNGDLFRNHGHYYPSNSDFYSNNDNKGDTYHPGHRHHSSTNNALLDVSLVPSVVDDDNDNERAGETSGQFTGHYGQSSHYSSGHSMAAFDPLMTSSMSSNEYVPGPTRPSASSSSTPFLTHIGSNEQSSSAYNSTPFLSHTPMSTDDNEQPQSAYNSTPSLLPQYTEDEDAGRELEQWLTSLTETGNIPEPKTVSSSLSTSLPHLLDRQPYLASPDPETSSIDSWTTAQNDYQSDRSFEAEEKGGNYYAEEGYGSDYKEQRRQRERRDTLTPEIGGEYRDALDGDYRETKERIGDFGETRERTGDYGETRERTGEYRETKARAGEYRETKERIGENRQTRERSGDYSDTMGGDYRDTKERMDYASDYGDEQLFTTKPRDPDHHHRERRDTLVQYMHDDYGNTAGDIIDSDEIFDRTLTSASSFLPPPESNLSYIHSSRPSECMTPKAALSPHMFDFHPRAAYNLPLVVDGLSKDADNKSGKSSVVLDKDRKGDGVITKEGVVGYIKESDSHIDDDDDGYYLGLRAQHQPNRSVISSSVSDTYTRRSKSPSSSSSSSPPPLLPSLLPLPSSLLYNETHAGQKQKLPQRKFTSVQNNSISSTGVAVTTKSNAGYGASGRERGRPLLLDGAVIRGERGTVPPPYTTTSEEYSGSMGQSNSSSQPESGSTSEEYYAADAEGINVTENTVHAADIVVVAATTESSGINNTAFECGANTVKSQGKDADKSHQNEPSEKSENASKETQKSVLVERTVSTNKTASNTSDSGANFSNLHQDKTAVNSSDSTSANFSSSKPDTDKTITEKASCANHSPPLKKENTDIQTIKRRQTNVTVGGSSTSLNKEDKDSTDDVPKVTSKLQSDSDVLDLGKTLRVSEYNNSTCRIDVIGQSDDAAVNDNVIRSDSDKQVKGVVVVESQQSKDVVVESPKSKDALDNIRELIQRQIAKQKSEERGYKGETEGKGEVAQDKPDWRQRQSEESGKETEGRGDKGKGDIERKQDWRQTQETKQREEREYRGETEEEGKGETERKGYKVKGEEQDWRETEQEEEVIEDVLATTDLPPDTSMSGRVKNMIQMFSSSKRQDSADSGSSSPPSRQESEEKQTTPEKDNTKEKERKSAGRQESVKRKSVERESSVKKGKGKATAETGPGTGRKSIERQDSKSKSRSPAPDSTKSIPADKQKQQQKQQRAGSEPKTIIINKNTDVIEPSSSAAYTKTTKTIKTIVKTNPPGASTSTTGTTSKNWKTESEYEQRIKEKKEKSPSPTDSPATPPWATQFLKRQNSGAVAAQQQIEPEKSLLYDSHSKGAESQQPIDQSDSSNKVGDKQSKQSSSTISSSISGNGSGSGGNEKSQKSNSRFFGSSTNSSSDKPPQQPPQQQQSGGGRELSGGKETEKSRTVNARENEKSTERKSWHMSKRSASLEPEGILNEREDLTANRSSSIFNRGSSSSGLPSSETAAGLTNNEGGGGGGGGVTPMLSQDLEEAQRIKNRFARSQSVDPDTKHEDTSPSSDMDKIAALRAKIQNKYKLTADSPTPKSVVDRDRDRERERDRDRSSRDTVVKPDRMIESKPPPAPMSSARKPVHSAPCSTSRQEVIEQEAFAEPDPQLSRLDQLRESIRSKYSIGSGSATPVGSITPSLSRASTPGPRSILDEDDFDHDQFLAARNAEQIGSGLDLVGHDFAALAQAPPMDEKTRLEELRRNIQSKYNIPQSTSSSSSHHRHGAASGAGSYASSSVLDEEEDFIGSRNGSFRRNGSHVVEDDEPPASARVVKPNPILEQVKAKLAPRLRQTKSASILDEDPVLTVAPQQEEDEIQYEDSPFHMDQTGYYHNDSSQMMIPAYHQQEFQDPYAPAPDISKMTKTEILKQNILNKARGLPPIDAAPARRQLPPTPPPPDPNKSSIDQLKDSILSKYKIAGRSNSSDRLLDSPSPSRRFQLRPSKSRNDLFDDEYESPAPPSVLNKSYDEENLERASRHSGRSSFVQNLINQHTAGGDSSIQNNEDISGSSVVSSSSTIRDPSPSRAGRFGRKARPPRDIKPREEQGSWRDRLKVRQEQQHQEQAASNGNGKVHHERNSRSGSLPNLAKPFSILDDEINIDISPQSPTSPTGDGGFSMTSGITSDDDASLIAAEDMRNIKNEGSSAFTGFCSRCYHELDKHRDDLDLGEVGKTNSLMCHCIDCKAAAEEFQAFKEGRYIYKSAIQREQEAREEVEKLEKLTAEKKKKSESSSTSSSPSSSHHQTHGANANTKSGAADTGADIKRKGTEFSHAEKTELDNTASEDFRVDQSVRDVLSVTTNNRDSIISTSTICANHDITEDTSKTADKAQLEQVKQAQTAEDTQKDSVAASELPDLNSASRGTAATAAATTQDREEEVVREGDSDEAAKVSVEFNSASSGSKEAKTPEKHGSSSVNNTTVTGTTTTTTNMHDEQQHPIASNTHPSSSSPQLIRITTDEHVDYKPALSSQQDHNHADEQCTAEAPPPPPPTVAAVRPLHLALPPSVIITEPDESGSTFHYPHSPPLAVSTPVLSPASVSSASPSPDVTISKLTNKISKLTLNLVVQPRPAQTPSPEGSKKVKVVSIGNTPVEEKSIEVVFSSRRKDSTVSTVSSSVVEEDEEEKEEKVEMDDVTLKEQAPVGSAADSKESDSVNDVVQSEEEDDDFIVYEPDVNDQDGGGAKKNDIEDVTKEVSDTDRKQSSDNVNEPQENKTDAIEQLNMLASTGDNNNITDQNNTEQNNELEEQSTTAKPHSTTRDHQRKFYSESEGESENSFEDCVEEMDDVREQEVSIEEVEENISEDMTEVTETEVTVLYREEEEEEDHSGEGGNNDTVIENGSFHPGDNDGMAKTEDEDFSQVAFIIGGSAEHSEDNILNSTEEMEDDDDDEEEEEEQNEQDLMDGGHSADDEEDDVDHHNHNDNDNDDNQQVSYDYYEHPMDHTYDPNSHPYDPNNHHHSNPTNQGCIPKNRSYDPMHRTFDPVSAASYDNPLNRTYEREDWSPYDTDPELDEPVTDSGSDLDLDNDPEDDGLAPVSYIESDYKPLEEALAEEDNLVAGLSNNEPKRGYKSDEDGLVAANNVSEPNSLTYTKEEVEQKREHKVVEKQETSTIPDSPITNKASEFISGFKAVFGLKSVSAAKDISSSEPVLSTEAVSAKEGVSDSKSGSSKEVGSVSDKDAVSKVDSGSEKSVFGDYKSLSGSNTVSEGSKVVSDGSKTVSEGSKTVSEDSKVVSEGSKTVSEGSNTVSEGSKADSESSKTVLEADSLDSSTAPIPVVRYAVFRERTITRLQTLGERNKERQTRYRRCLDNTEATRRTQMRIMRKTHEAHLADKQALVRNLEEVIEQQEARIAALTASGSQENSAGKSTTEPSPTLALVAQIEQLHAENAELRHSLLTAKEENSAAEAAAAAMEEDEEEDVCAPQAGSTTSSTEIHRLKEENSRLQEENTKLQHDLHSTIQSSGTTDTEKQLHVLEAENDALRDKLRQQEAENASLTQQIDTVTQLEAKIEKLKEENRALREQLESLKQEMSSNTSAGRQREEQLKEEIKHLTEESQKSAREVRELTVQLVSLQAKSPEVVTRYKKVESEGLREELEACKISLHASQAENKKLQHQLHTLEQQGAEAKQQIEDMQKKVSQALCREEETAHLSKELKTMKANYEDKTKQLNQANHKMQALKTKVAETEKQLTGLEQQHEAEMERVKTQDEKKLVAVTRETKERATRLHTQLQCTAQALTDIKDEYTALQQATQAWPQLVESTLISTKHQIVRAISDVSKHNQELVRKYRKEMALRKKFHNELVELKGNIRVFCRVRPSIKEDGGATGVVNVITYDTDDDSILAVTHKGRVQAFEMDRVFQPSVSQQEVFHEVAALVTSCIDGYNVCIFAYGQTGSGKTYTMEGSRKDAGINQRALAELFQEIRERSGEWQYTLSVSVMEIYNETLRDLLNSSANKLEIKISSEQGGSLHVPGLKSTIVSSVDDVNQVFRLGQENRATACTNMNEHSSRSHALLQVKVEGVNTTTGAKTHGKLNLVDLAGSERVSKSGADGARLKEAQSINKSLACLGDVIHALRTKQPHIPYRNSKLTYLLQDSLGGDSKTLMIVQVAPVEKNVSETLASLNFGQRVRTVELGQASKRTELAEVTELKEKLAQYESEHGVSNGSRALRPNNSNPPSTPANSKQRLNNVNNNSNTKRKINSAFDRE